MSLFSIVCVLVFEQFKALPAVITRSWLRVYAAFLERQFNGGLYRHGMTAWGVGAALPAMLILLADLALGWLHPLLAFLFGLIVLYLTMGLRQFSHYFTDIQLALRMGEVDRARQLLAEWRGIGSERLGSAEISRLAIEHGILSSQRNVFAPLFWFVVLGPAGALLYRLSLALTENWRLSAEAQVVERGEFAAFAENAYYLLNWIPARLTAIAFAIVGDFEDAVFCWRTQAEQWPDTASGILLATGAGALGVRLGLPLPEVAGIEVRPELGLGDDADVEHLQSAIGLVWRALVLCLLLLALLTAARWVGA